ncbi:hypothetical protein EN817_02900 [Mesorhizobium sp. M3A.F.Ca.ET.174.01.1.1]|uniref:hypothetical protein n=1 Tax=unclassified Mesorhizobium TaxID=325217 RepID=UPI0010936981|nr:MULTISPECIES: hypothetical protein [unclassified Mesorhizobium]TGS89314.1 hypothetical protein EN818_02900 [Mesorhizobium sp. M3A.F.Ca.ET.175.01.1.1]TGT31087.1 hypothetical protein EN817_02900 [Mesorhizobium sp. M3A.F.Ca.ET.174.01.1.1]
MPGTVYTVRFRFRVGKHLQVDDTQLELHLSGKKATLTGESKETAISENEWLIMKVGEFASEDDARSFAMRMKNATLISSLFVRLGVDAGFEKQAGWISDELLKQMNAESGKTYRPVIHGIDVYPDDGAVGVYKISATGVVRTNPGPFFECIDSLLAKGDLDLPDALIKAITLLNSALMNPEPLAQLVLAISTVEGLGQDEDWLPDQKALIAEAAKLAEHASGLAVEETAEVVEAIKRHSHHLSLRQGVLRALEKAGLSSLKKEWDDVYGYRSAIFHKGHIGKEVEYSIFAGRAVTICGHIILKTCEQYLQGASAMADKYFPLSG